MTPHDGEHTQADHRGSTGPKESNALESDLPLLVVPLFKLEYQPWV